ncbi:MAG TPA: sulfotransferase [Rhizomicrobium sp.]|nr:sulfotransferase [Rhizomicrobium sp.]
MAQNAAQLYARADEAARLGRFEDAERLLAESLAIAPTAIEIRERYAMLLLDRLDKPAQALIQVDTLMEAKPGNMAYRALRAAILGILGDYAQAIAGYEAVLAKTPQDHRSWLRYGHMLKTIGRTDDAVVAYRRSIALKPGNGEAYWSIADLKTVRLTSRDCADMRTAMQSASVSDADRSFLHFALGKALEDDGDFRAAFGQYDMGNALRRAAIRYDPAEMTRCLRASEGIFTPEFFTSRSGHGAADPDPIFIVGLPRSGSTLVEQILASHADVEGTMELPDLVAISRRVSPDAAHFPQSLADYSVSAFRALGEEYIARTQPFRRLGRRFFIDKFSGNFILIPLIHLALPNAKIIDVRRHPMACCFSAFKQSFAGGQNFSYGLNDLGRFYAEYVALMDLHDRVLPGRVHRVIYEDLVADTDHEVRRLLDYCGLPFDENCLRFYDTERAVRTASAQQVRRPISAEGLEHWRHFEAFLEPLKAALGPVLEAYPGVPR